MISEYLGFDSDYIILGLAAFCVILFILTVVNMAKTSKLRKKHDGKRCKIIGRNFGNSFVSGR